MQKMQFLINSNHFREKLTKFMVYEDGMYRVICHLSFARRNTHLFLSEKQERYVNE